MPPKASASESLDGSLVEKRGRPSVGIDDAHLAADDIDELWQSVDARQSKDRAERRWFATPEGRAAIRIVPDSPELQHLETTAAEPNTGLSDQNGTRAFCSDCERHQQHQRRGKCEQRASDDEIDEPPHLICRAIVTASPGELLQEGAHEASVPPGCDRGIKIS